MVAGWGRRRGRVVIRSAVALCLCLLLSQRAEADNAAGATAPPAAAEDDVTEYSIRRGSSTLPSSATLTSRASRGAVLLMGNGKQFGDASPQATTAQEKDTTSHRPVNVSTALETPRGGGGSLSDFLSSHTGSNRNSGSDSNECQQKAMDSDDSAKGEDSTMMMTVGTILMGKMIMLMPIMIMKSASELLESLLSLAMKLVELVQKLLERKSEGGGGKNGDGGGGGGEGKGATHKQVVVLQLPKDKHEPWSSGHVPHVVEDEGYVEGPPPGQGWSDEHGFHASGFHPLEWSPQPGGSGWQDWGVHRHNKARRRAGAAQQPAGASLAYRHWGPRTKPAHQRPATHTV